MKKEKLSYNTLHGSEEIFPPDVSVVCIILGFHAGRLKMLLCKFEVGDKWMLPEGLVAKGKDPDESVLHVLEGKTGVKDVYVRQFYFFGRKEEINIKENKETQQFPEADHDNEQRHLNSFISLGYYALVKYEDVEVEAGDNEEAKWFDITDLPPLYVEHEKIIDRAINIIRRQIGFVPMGYELLPEKFTMPELRAIYEAILGRTLDRRNFQRKMLATGYIQPLNEIRKMGPHKSPNLYSFIKDKCEKADQYGIQLMSNNF